MKRRNFIFSSIAGLIAANTLMNTALALPSFKNRPSTKEKSFKKLSETTIDNFKYKGHKVKIVKQVGQDKSKARVDRWTMIFNDRELPQGYFSRSDKGCYSSRLLPFYDEDNNCVPRKLAEELIEGHMMNLYELNPIDY